MARSRSYPAVDGYGAPLAVELTDSPVGLGDDSGPGVFVSSLLAPAFSERANALLCERQRLAAKGRASPASLTLSQAGAPGERADASLTEKSPTGAGLKFPAEVDLPFWAMSQRPEIRRAHS